MRFLLGENNMNIKELNKSKLPIVRIDNDLEQYADKVAFPDKLEKANKVLNSVGLPKTRKIKNNPLGTSPARRTRA